MANTPKALRKLLSDGETEKTLAALKIIFERNGDTSRLTDTTLLTNRFNQNKISFHRGILSQTDFNLENNQIAAAVLDLIEQVPPSADLSIETKAVTRKAGWEKWTVIIGIFAAMAGVTGYIMLRDFFKKPAPVQIQLPAHSTEKPIESIAKPAEKATSAQPGKNNPTITVKDKAKVGIINTGDSATFKNVKQDF